MDIGRIQRRFTAEPVDSPVPATPEVIPAATPEALLEHASEQAPATVTADARS